MSASVRRRGYARHVLVPKGLAAFGTWENIDASNQEQAASRMCAIFADMSCCKSIHDETVQANFSLGVCGSNVDRRPYAKGTMSFIATRCIVGRHAHFG